MDDVIRLFVVVGKYMARKLKISSRIQKTEALVRKDYLHDCPVFIVHWFCSCISEVTFPYIFKRGYKIAG